LILPVDVCLNAPEKSQNCHQQNCHDPKNPSKQSLVGKEDVDQALVVVRFKA